MTDGGIAAMEIVARDLKSMGLYTARALSFAGVEYDPLEHQLTPDQIDIYDAYADAWAIIHQNLDEVLMASNIVDRMSGQTMNAQAKGSALSRFASAKQRFFSRVLISRSEEHTSALQSLLRHSYAVFCLKKKHNSPHQQTHDRR